MTIDSPEALIARGIARRSLYVAPLWLLAAGLIWGVGGAASAAYALALVVANFAAAAALINWSVRISPVALMLTVLVGFALRLGILLLLVLAVSGLSLFEPVPLAITIAAGHLGLLVNEIRYVSASLSLPLSAPNSSGPNPPGPNPPGKETL